MPLSDYGVAIGTYISFARDPQDQYGHWYHGHLTIQTPAGQYQSALDVDTPSGVGVSFKAIPNLDVGLFATVNALSDAGASAAIHIDLGGPRLCSGRSAANALFAASSRN